MKEFFDLFSDDVTRYSPNLNSVPKRFNHSTLKYSRIEIDDSTTTTPRTDLIYIDLRVPLLMLMTVKMGGELELTSSSWLMTLVRCLTISSSESGGGRNDFRMDASASSLFARSGREAVMYCVDASSWERGAWSHVVCVRACVRACVCVCVRYWMIYIYCFLGRGGEGCGFQFPP